MTIKHCMIGISVSSIVLLLLCGVAVQRRNEMTRPQEIATTIHEQNN